LSGSSQWPGTALSILSSFFAGPTRLNSSTRFDQAVAADPVLEAAVPPVPQVGRMVDRVLESDKRAARAEPPVSAAPAGFPASAFPEDSLAVAAVDMADCRVSDQAWVYREDFPVVSPETVLYRPPFVLRAQSFRCH
jgi:hypothetical protein